MTGRGSFNLNFQKTSVESKNVLMMKCKSARAWYQPKIVHKFLALKIVVENCIKRLLRDKYIFPDISP